MTPTSSTQFFSPFLLSGEQGPTSALTAPCDFTSPNYPQPYSSDSRISYTIRAISGMVSYLCKTNFKMKF